MQAYAKKGMADANTGQPQLIVKEAGDNQAAASFQAPLGLQAAQDLSQAPHDSGSKRNMNIHTANQESLQPNGGDPNQRQTNSHNLEERTVVKTEPNTNAQNHTLANLREPTDDRVAKDVTREDPTLRKAQANEPILEEIKDNPVLERIEPNAQ